MILTVTLNPAADKTLVVDGVVVGEVNRVRESYLDPGGKGINVSRMAHRLGFATMALGFAGGEIGRLVAEALRDEGVQHYFSPVDGQTRLNVILIDSLVNTSTRFYTPGPTVTADALQGLFIQVERWLPASKVVVLGGSLPPGVPPDTYARLVRLAQGYGVKTVLDTDDEPLKLGVEARPTLIKPNLEEAERLLGMPLDSRSAVVAAAQELVRRGISYVVISLGAQGAIGAWDGEVWHVAPPEVRRQSTVGSGDSMVAGLACALAQGRDMIEGLKLGTAAGAATAMTPGTALGLPEDVEKLLPQVQPQRLST